MIKNNSNYGPFPTSVAQVKQYIADSLGAPSGALVTAGPELVEWLIEHDTHNRKRRPAKVAQLTREMIDGKWYITNQGIGLTVGNFVADGGHRLQAMRAAGYPPVRFFLIWNIDDAAQVVVDRHDKRRMAAIMELVHNVTVNHRVIAVVNVIIKARKDRFTTDTQDVDKVSEVIDEMLDVIKMFTELPKASKLSAPVVAALATRFYELSNDKIVTFAEQLIHGEMLAKGDPAYTLLHNCLDRTIKSSGGAVVQEERYFKTLAAIDAFLEGRKIYRLPNPTFKA